MKKHQKKKTGRGRRWLFLQRLIEKKLFNEYHKTDYHCQVNIHSRYMRLAE